jgi:hypothetical protein
MTFEDFKRSITQLGAVVCVMPVCAAAQVPDATYLSFASYGNSAGPPDDISVSNSITTSGLVTVDNGAFASVIDTPNPTLTAQAYGAILGLYLGYGGNSLASINYYAEVVGPADYVPVDMQYSGQWSQTGPDPETFGYAYDAIFSDGGYGGLVAGGTVFRSDMDSSNVFSGSISYLSPTYAPFKISLSTQVIAGEYNGSSAYLRLDPTLFIDPSFASVDPNYLQDYSIILSSGIGNAPDAVPEPGAWMLLLAGMGILGVATRCKRRDSGQAAIVPATKA